MILFSTKNALRVQRLVSGASRRPPYALSLFQPRDRSEHPGLLSHPRSLHPSSRQASSNSKPRPAIFRVCDIPQMPPTEVKAFISNLIQARLGPNEAHIKFNISPIPSCYSSARNTSSALLKIENGYPDFLMDIVIDPLDMLHFDVGSDEEGGREKRRIGITVDQHFHGFTQSYFTTPGEEITAE